MLDIFQNSGFCQGVVTRNSRYYPFSNIMEYFFIGIFEGVSIALGFMELHVRRDPALSAFVVLVLAIVSTRCAYFILLFLPGYIQCPIDSGQSGFFTPCDI